MTTNLTLIIVQQNAKNEILENESESKSAS